MHYFLEFIGCYNGLIYQHIGCATLVALNSQAFFWGVDLFGSNANGCESS